jgi:hypothetical protein
MSSAESESPFEEPATAPGLNWVLLAFCLLSGVGAGAVYLFPSAGPIPVATLPADFVPQTELTPREVVALQLAAMKESRTRPDAIADCFALASPENRAVTGPLARFEELVHSPAYLPLVEQRVATIGSAVVRDRHATVVVNVIDRHNRACIFRFFLSQQPLPEAGACWLTDAVIQEGSVDAGSTETSQPTI